MRALVLEPDAPLCDLLNDFIQEFVFVNHNYGMCLRRDSRALDRVESVRVESKLQDYTYFIDANFQKRLRRGAYTR